MTVAQSSPTERDVAAAWNDGLFRGPFRLIDGREVEIVHRGTWTHGFGPDFRDALIAVGGRELVTGSVEIHLRASGWRAHGHHLDPRYNDVVLHVVLEDDGGETRRMDGKLVPVLALPAECQALIEPRGPVDWSLVGGEVCAAHLTATRPEVVRRALSDLGDMRLAAKVARLEGQLAERPPADVLYREIFDGLGYSANREPMRALADRLPLSAIEGVLGALTDRARYSAAGGILFGVAGFLPISPTDAAAAGWRPDLIATVEEGWGRFGPPWHDAVLSPAVWTRARVRPTNHPARRLAAGAALLANAQGGLLPTLMDELRNGADVTELLCRLCAISDEALVGRDRAAGIVVNAIVPFALALSEQSGDLILGEAAARAWEGMPAAESNEVTRRGLRQVAGAVRLSGLGARGQQGLIQLDLTLCRPRRCFECPIAAAVLFDGSA
jgi:hypothetical protein